MNRIKQLRREFGYSQEALAKIMNCTGMTISRYETGKGEMDTATINRLCDVFDCTSDYLLCRTDVPNGQLPATEEELRPVLNAKIYDLTPEEQAMVEAFVAGLRASRKNKSK